MFITKIKFLKILLGITYFLVAILTFKYYNHLDIQECQETKYSTNQYTYSCKITSNISKEVLLGIGVDDILENIIFNKKNISMESLKKQYNVEKLDDYKQGYSFVLPFNEGENLIEIFGKNTGGAHAVFINQSISFTQYVLGFIVFFIPIIYILAQLFFKLLDKESIKINRIILPIIIILIGIVLRIFVLNSIQNWEHQHDYSGHVEAIKYYAENPLTPPQPDKGLQYPQQPLYYLMMGTLYNIGDVFNWSERERIYSIRAFSVFLAGGVMLLGWYLVRLYTRKELLINIFLSFLSFTPSFVLMGAFVNNDTLNVFFGVLALLGVSLYYKKPKTLYFILASVSILLAMLTKVSSILLTILFAVVLIYHYKSKLYKHINTIQREALFFSIAVLFVFGWTLFKAYIPMSGEFRFVNSALYFNQIIPYLGLSYFFTFNWFDLIEHAQATVLYNDNIRFSLPTYFYGTMFLEDHIYDKKYLEGGIFKLSAQLTYILGIIYLAGFFSYFFFFRKLETMSKFLIIPIIINLLLIIKFLNDYWVVCNSHFRYFSPVFSAIGLTFVLGLEQLFKRYTLSAKIVAILAVPFYLAQIYWLIKLIKLS